LYSEYMYIFSVEPFVMIAHFQVRSAVAVSGNEAGSAASQY